MSKPFPPLYEPGLPPLPLLVGRSVPGGRTTLGFGMAYIITEPCIGTKDKSCVDVCPVDCIHGDDDDKMLFIDPEVCID